MVRIHQGALVNRVGYWDLSQTGVAFLAVSLISQDTSQPSWNGRHPPEFHADFTRAETNGPSSPSVACRSEPGLQVSSSSRPGWPVEMMPIA